MKKHILLTWLFIIPFMIPVLTACSDDEDSNFDDDTAYPPPTVSVTSQANIVGVYDQSMKVTGKMESEFGIRDIYCTLMKTGEKGYVEIDKNKRVIYSIEGEQKSVDFSIDVPIYSEEATAIKVVGLNSITKTVEQLIIIDGIVHKPVISFQKDKDTRNTVCIGIPFRISGSVENDCEVKSISLIPVVNGTAHTQVQATIKSDNVVDYSEMIPVESGLEHVIVRAENIYGGISEKIYTILRVVDQDFALFEIQNEEDALRNIVGGEKNTLYANVTSGSDLVSLKYAVKAGGVYGTAKEITLPGNTENELDFEFELDAPANMETVQLEVTNLSGVTAKVDYPVTLTRRAAIVRDMEMSTDPADNKCFLALYEPVQVFGRDIAITKQDRIDWVLTQNGAQAQPVSPHAYGAGAAYYNRTSPYIMGFTDLTYLFLSALRGNITKADIDNIKTDYEIDMYIRDVIVPGGYNVPTASRRVGDNYSATGKNSGGFLIGWGDHTHPNVSPSVVSNVAFGVVWVKSVTLKPNGHTVITFDVIYPSVDQRTPNNAASIEPYDPYPL